MRKTAKTGAKLGARYQRMLVPVDFSKPSLLALHTALGLARGARTRIVLLHVYERPTFLSGYQALPAAVALPDDEVAAKIKLQLDSIIAANEVETPISSFVRKGKPFQEIVKFAKRDKTDLIVIGTHGFTGLKHVLIGSTAERVVRHAHCPVFVVREAG